MIGITQTNNFYVLLVTIIIAFVLNLVVVIFCLVTQIVGFNSDGTPITLCNSYLTLKFSQNNRYVYSASFSAACASCIFLAICLIVAILVKIKDQKSIALQQYVEYLINTHNLLYVFLSLTLMVSTSLIGNYITLIYQQGSCLLQKKSQWIVVLVLGSIAMIASIIAWGLNLSLLNKLNNHKEETKNQNVQQETVSFGEQTPSQIVKIIHQQQKYDNTPILVRHQQINQKSYADTFIKQSQNHNQSKIQQSRQESFTPRQFSNKSYLQALNSNQKRPFKEHRFKIPQRKNIIQFPKASFLIQQYKLKKAKAQLNAQIKQKINYKSAETYNNIQTQKQIQLKRYQKRLDDGFFNRYIEQDELKNEQLKMFIFSKESQRLQDTSLMFKKDKKKQKRQLFQRQLTQDPRTIQNKMQLSQREIRHKQQEIQIINNLKQKFLS